MIHLEHFREEVIRRATRHIGLWSPEAEELLVGTAAQESRLGRYLVQLGNGPARGVFQMEPRTHHDIWENYLQYRPRLAGAVADLAANRRPTAEQLSWNMGYAAAMARVCYWRLPFRLPRVDDLEGQARAWKRWYNTRLGAGTEEEYIESYLELVGSPPQ